MWCFFLLCEKSIYLFTTIAEQFEEYNSLWAETIVICAILIRFQCQSKTTSVKHHLTNRKRKKNKNTVRTHSKTTTTWIGRMPFTDWDYEIMCRINVSAQGRQAIQKKIKKKNQSWNGTTTKKKTNPDWRRIICRALICVHFSIFTRHFSVS